MNQHLLLKIAGVYEGSVTTDDLSPSGDAVAYRSNPLKLAEFTMINKDVEYVKRAEEILEIESFRREGVTIPDGEWKTLLSEICRDLNCSESAITIGSVMVGNEIGDGSSREQAASSQKILGGYANIAVEYVTKRYRSNLINWGMLPIITEDLTNLHIGDYILIRNVGEVIRNSSQTFEMEVKGSVNTIIRGNIGEMTKEEKEILLSGCLINYNKALLQDGTQSSNQ
jgi:aconitate hydratase